jgi:hypothetical protein
MRTPNYSLDAEKSVLGSILLTPEALALARETLQQDDFWYEAHGYIFEAMESLEERKEPIDALTVEAELFRLGTAALVQPKNLDIYLIDLMEAPLSAANIGHYSSLVKRESNKRLMGERLKEAYSILTTDPEGLERIADSNGRYSLSEIARSSVIAESDRVFRRGILNSTQLSDEEEILPPLWFALYSGALTYICGETGTGKSSWLYNVVVHAARNEPLWDIRFAAGGPLKVFYIDPENSGDFDHGLGGLVNQKLMRIGAGKPINLDFHDGQNVNLSKPDQMAALTRLIRDKKYQVLILDPIINLFGTKDENDNAEAGAQFAALKLLCKQTGCCVIAVHHTGKDNTGIFGRGATARLGAADVGIVMRVRGEKEETSDDYQEGGHNARNEVVRVQIVKNRMEPFKSSLFLRMIGDDKFERVSFEVWKDAARTHNRGPDSESGAEVRKLYQAKESIQLLLVGGISLSTDSIIESLRNEGIGHNTVRIALGEMVEDNCLQKERIGRTILYKTAPSE